jgi:hypothetical protein
LILRTEPRRLARFVAAHRQPRRQEVLAALRADTTIDLRLPQSVVAGASLANARYATEELEETAKLFLMLRSLPIRPLTPAQVGELREKYNLR